jgi:hypothetical protein
MFTSDTVGVGVINSDSMIEKLKQIVWNKNQS